MDFSRPSLHPPVIEASDDFELAGSQLLALLRQQPAPAGEADATSGFIEIPLTTVSLSGNFDSYISVGIRSSAPEKLMIPLLFDTGNTVLVLPWWEQIAALPDWQSHYQILCQGQEPWGCPANVVKGPIEILTKAGKTYTLRGCVFYACTGVASKGGSRTANFGAGRITVAQTVCGKHPILTPLMYNTARPFVEINLAPAETVLDPSGALKVAPGSFLRLYKAMPTGYSLFDIVAGQYWMSLVPKSLTIAKVKTTWPGNLQQPIAMVDTGGGPANLSDPGGNLSNRNWPDEVPNPDWVNSSAGSCVKSTNCKSTKTDLTLELGDAANSFTYLIDTRVLPSSVRGLTLVMCQTNCFMEGQNGMNIGGISALSLHILIDYQNSQVGLMAKTATAAA